MREGGGGEEREGGWERRGDRDRGGIWERRGGGEKEEGRGEKEEGIGTIPQLQCMYSHYSVHNSRADTDYT